MSNSPRSSRTRNIVIGAILLLIFALLLWLNHVPSPGPSASSPRATRAERPPTTSPSLKVGVYLSKYTADQIGGYSCQMTAELLHRNLTVIPLLEPGTESEPAIAKLLSVYFRGQ